MVEYILIQLHLLQPFESYIINAYVDAPVYFNYTTTDDINSWYWNFGDGKHSIDQNPIHIYNETGKYDVTLLITIGEESKVIYYTIDVIDKLVADFDYIQDGNRIYFLNKAKGAQLTYDINWGNGVIESNIDMSNVYPGTGGANHGYVYPSGKYGSFNVTLTVTDKFGKTDNITKIINIYNSKQYVLDVDSFENGTDGWSVPDSAVISSDYAKDGEHSIITGGYMEKVINFDNVDSIEYYAYSTHESGGLRYADLYIDGVLVLHTGFYHYNWARHSYSTTDLVGNHTVRITGNFYVDYIALNTNNYYLANFSTVINDIDGDDITVSFTDESYGTYNSVFWTFDGENTSTLQNPTCAFKKGNHEVTLIIYRDGIKMSSVTKVLSLANYCRH